MYEAPEVVDLGSLEELTEKKVKFGPHPDKFSAVSFDFKGSVYTGP